MSDEQFRALRREAMAGIKLDADCEMTGFDVDPSVIRMARQNAEEAGVGDLIRFVTTDMRKVRFPENFGVLITNPPYGKRLSPEEGIESLMDDFAQQFLSLRTWSVYVITSFPAFEKMAGRTASRRRKLFNGGEETTFYQFLGLNPHRFQTSE